MKKDASRLDVPGFALGIKTGEFVDVPKLYGGRPQPKKSGHPHAMSELIAAQTVSRARKAIQLATQIVKKDYYKRKRSRLRVLKRPTNSAPIRACNRRFFEHMGMKAQFLAYAESPELFISKAKTAYEITDGFCPMVTVTSAREALLICAALARYGIAAYFNKITPRGVSHVTL